MRMTCKYVYLNVFYKNTYRQSERERERETRGDLPTLSLVASFSVIVALSQQTI